METSSPNQLKGNVNTAVTTNNTCSHPTLYVSSILPNGINTNNKPIAGIDWGGDNIVINEKDKPIAKFKTLSEAAPYYKGYVWVLESTADSFELQNRQIDLDAIKSANIEAYCFNPKFTAYYRKQWDILKTDEKDAGIIRRIFTETPLKCGKFKQLIEKNELRDRINNSLIRDRYLFNGAESISTAEKYLPTFENVPIHFREFIYQSASIKSKNPKKPKVTTHVGRFLMAALEVRKDKLGWRTFLRQVGAYGQGYACMLRSEYYHWIIEIVLTRRLKQNKIEETYKITHVSPKTGKKEKIRIWTPSEIQIKKQVMKEMSKVLRWLWQTTTNFKV